MVADAVKSNLTNVRVICLNRLYFHNVSDNLLEFKQHLNLMETIFINNS
jgi:hypothetical protein